MVRWLQIIAKLACCLSPLAGTPWMPTGLPPVDPTTVGFLCQREYLTEAAGADVLRQYSDRLRTTEQWQALREQLRESILVGMGLHPLPQKQPLQVINHSLRVLDGYSIENIAIETLPGFWLTGNLYRPLGRTSPTAAVIHPHGHTPGIHGSAGWQAHGRFKPEEQIRAATLARLGAICLSVDMVGYGDQIALMGERAHRQPQAMALQFWNGLRAIDYLEGLPEVDPRRIAVTAHSGGATQGFILAALDSRIAVQISVAMASAHYFGGCPCESGLPIHRSERHFVSNPVILAMMAPRPLLLISVGGDWTRNTPRVEYPFIAGIYALYGAQQQFANVHLATEGHDYGPGKRSALYDFASRWLGLDPATDNPEAGWGSDGFKALSADALRVFGAGHAIPDAAHPSPQAAYAALIGASGQP